VHAVDTRTSSPSGAPGDQHPGVRVRHAPLHVLVAQAEDADRASLVAAVTAMGHSCRAARDGLEAWEMHSRSRADVIVSDWRMPRLSGLELCRRTRGACEKGRYTYFILTAPHHDKDHYLRGMKSGADDYCTKPVDPDELGARLLAAERLLGVYRDLAERNASLRRDSQASFHLARLDALTEVANRLSLDEDLRALFPRVSRYALHYSLAMCDLDLFKAHNDAFGHVAGDEALRRIAGVIRQQVRAGDGVYRYGGEEFAVLLPEQALPAAVRAMERVRAAVELLAIPASREGGILTISVGVAELDPSVHKAPEDWVRSADAGLYRAKVSGRNRVDVAPPVGLSARREGT